jgi:uncharacterized protein YggT (Ycf19 family)
MQQLSLRLAQLSLAHLVITLVGGALILCLIVRMVMSLVLQGRENQFSLFFARVTGPILDPLDRLIPAISLGGISFRISWLFAWWAITIVSALLYQALPAGW